MMCILGSTDLPHPPIECIITVQEEVGKKGGMLFDPAQVTGKRLIDFNWHKPDTIFAGCAGDISVYYRLPVTYEPASDDMKFFMLSLEGGLGGHSEFDINLERANALVTFGRLVNSISKECEIHFTELTGGVNRYVIPGNMGSIVAVRLSDVEIAKEVVRKVSEDIRNEYKLTDEKLAVSFVETEEEKSVMSFADTRKIAKSLRLLPCGVCSMSMEIPGLVESSSTVAMIETQDNVVSILSTIPSAVSSRKYDILQKIFDLAELTGASVDTFADCPEWPYKPESELLAIAKKAFLDLYGYEPGVEVSHSSLELGLFNAKIPGIEMISLGPKAYDVHTTKESLDWTTVAMVWNHIKEILKELND